MPRRLTTEEFIDKAKAVHGDRYDYSSVNYVNAHAKIIIICPDHGPFTQSPTNHLAKSRNIGCPDCGGNRPLTTETFIEKAKAIHGDRYDYSSVNYVNTQTNVTIICSDHGPFPQTPGNHLANHGCPDCGGKKQLTTQAFIEKAKAIHGDRYDYSSVNYVNANTNVTIICPDHGPFDQVPPSHLSERGCPYCGGTKPLTTDTFIQKAIAIHGSRYDYSFVNYVNANTKVTIICPDHGPFTQTPGNHFSKQGCPDCAGTKQLTTEAFIEKAKAIHGDRYDYSSVNYVNTYTNVTIICSDHGPFPQSPSNHLSKGRYIGCPDCADYGFKPNESAVLYYLAITTDAGDTRYKIGITNHTVEKRFPAPDLARIRLVKAWRYAIGRVAAEREAEVLRQYAGDKYYGPKILVGAGNNEIFTHDILGLDKRDEENV